MRIPTFSILALATLCSTTAFAAPQSYPANSDYKALYTGTPHDKFLSSTGHGLYSLRERERARGSAMAMRPDESTTGRD